MFKHARVLLAGIAALASLQASPSAFAEEDESPVVPVRSAMPAAQQSTVFGAPPLGNSALAASRGGAQVVSDMRLKGVVADNEAINVATGSNLITDGAFANAAGVPMVIQNSGNNVLIQNATIVNVQMK